MKRRSFLKVLMGGVAISALPTLSATEIQLPIYALTQIDRRRTALHIGREVHEAYELFLEQNYMEIIDDFLFKRLTVYIQDIVEPYYRNGLISAYQVISDATNNPPNSRIRYPNLDVRYTYDSDNSVLCVISCGEQS